MQPNPADILRGMRRSRDRDVTVGKYTFTIRRPRKYDLAEMHESKASTYDMACRFVVGWKGVTEADLVPAGGSDAVAFDSSIWEEWLADRPDFWEPIRTALMQSIVDHSEQLEADEKN